MSTRNQQNSVVLRDKSQQKELFNQSQHEELQQKFQSLDSFDPIQEDETLPSDLKIRENKKKAKTLIANNVCNKSSERVQQSQSQMDKIQSDYQSKGCETVLRMKNQGFSRYKQLNKSQITIVKKNGRQNKNKHTIIQINNEASPNQSGKGSGSPTEIQNINLASPLKNHNPSLLLSKNNYGNQKSKQQFVTMITNKTPRNFQSQHQIQIPNNQYNVPLQTSQNNNPSISKNLTLFIRIYRIFRTFLRQTESRRFLSLSDQNFQIVDDRCYIRQKSDKERKEQDGTQTTGRQLKKRQSSMNFAKKMQMDLMTKSVRDQELKESQNEQQNICQQYNKFLNQKIDLVNRTMQKIPILFPTQVLPIFINFLMFFQILVNFFLFSVNIAFEMNFNKVHFQNMLIIGAVVTTLHMFLQVNCAYYYKGKTLRKLFVRIERIYINAGMQSHLYSIIKLLAILVVLSHIIGILWHGLALLEENYLNEPNHWIQKLDLMNEPWYIQYMYSFYWATSTMMLVGPIGYNFIEVLFTTVVVLLTVGVFAYVISEIGQIIQQINLKNQEYKNDLKTINQYMNNRQISLQLKGSIRNYLEYLFDCHDTMQSNQESTKIMDKLPPLLYYNIKQEIANHILPKFSILQDFFTDETRKKLVNILEEQLYIPSQAIFRPGLQVKCQQDTSIYFLAQGEVNLVYPKQFKKKSAILRTIKDGEIFGDYNFFTGTQYEYTALCITPCTVYKIDRQKFLDIININNNNEPSQDYQKFCHIKDDLIIKQKSYIYPRRCVLCDQMDHQEIYCNQVNYNPDKYYVIQKNCFSPIIEDRVKLSKPRQIIRSSARQDLDAVQFAQDQIYKQFETLQDKALKHIVLNSQEDEYLQRIEMHYEIIEQVLTELKQKNQAFLEEQDFFTYSDEDDYTSDMMESLSQTQLYEKKSDPKHLSDLESNYDKDNNQDDQNLATIEETNQEHQIQSNFSNLNLFTSNQQIMLQQLKKVESQQHNSSKQQSSGKNINSNQNLNGGGSSLLQNMNNNSDPGDSYLSPKRKKDRRSSFNIHIDYKQSPHRKNNTVNSGDGGEGSPQHKPIHANGRRQSKIGMNQFAQMEQLSLFCDKDKKRNSLDNLQQPELKKNPSNIFQSKEIKDKEDQQKISFQILQQTSNYQPPSELKLKKDISRNKGRRQSMVFQPMNQKQIQFDNQKSKRFVGQDQMLTQQMTKQGYKGYMGQSQMSKMSKMSVCNIPVNQDHNFIWIYFETLKNFKQYKTQNNFKFGILKYYSVLNSSKKKKCSQPQKLGSKSQYDIQNQQTPNDTKNKVSRKKSNFTQAMNPNKKNKKRGSKQIELDINSLYQNNSQNKILSK